QVPVEVALDAGPSIVSEVHPQVGSRRPADLSHDAKRELEQPVEIVQLCRLEAGVVRGVPLRHHHEVPVVVRVAIEYREALRAPAEDEVFPVRLRAGLGQEATEDASLLAGRMDELAPPRGPEVVHQGSALPGVGIRSRGPGAESTSPIRVESECTSVCASSPNSARMNGLSLLGYSMRGSPRI